VAVPDASVTVISASAKLREQGASGRLRSASLILAYKIAQ